MEKLDGVNEEEVGGGTMACDYGSFPQATWSRKKNTEKNEEEEKQDEEVGMHM